MYTENLIKITFYIYTEKKFFYNILFILHLTMTSSKITFICVFLLDQKNNKYLDDKHTF